MAAISSISNGEALSSVRTKLNNVITNVNLLDPTDWVDYSATSTIVGWSSKTTTIKYRIVGKQMFIIFYIDGTSNNTATTFTLPNNSLIFNQSSGRFVNNGVLTAGFSSIQSASNIVTLYSSISSTTWTASGTKTVSGQFFIEIA